MEQKIFDDFPKVDCNDCSHYWDSSCDSVSKGSERPCKDFLATRNIDIPAKIKSFENHVKYLTRLSAGFWLLFILHILGHIISGLL